MPKNIYHLFCNDLTWITNVQNTLFGKIFEPNDTKNIDNSRRYVTRNYEMITSHIIFLRKWKKIYIYIDYINTKLQEMQLQFGKQLVRKNLKESALCTEMELKEYHWVILTEV